MSFFMIVHKVWVRSEKQQNSNFQTPRQIGAELANSVCDAISRIVSRLFRRFPCLAPSRWGTEDPIPRESQLAWVVLSCFWVRGWAWAPLPPPPPTDGPFTGRTDEFEATSLAVGRDVLERLYTIGGGGVTPPGPPPLHPLLLCD